MVHPVRKLLSLLFSFLIFSFVNVEAGATTPKKLTLIIWAGQSNAQGWMGDAAEYPADPAGLDKQIPFFYTSPGIGSSDNQWITLSPQKGLFPAGHFGPEVTFARELKKKGVDVAVFKYSLGATSIAKNWLLPGEKGLYDAMVAALESAVKQLKARDVEVTFGGFVWIQGESDAQTPQMASEYQKKLEIIIKDLRGRVTNTPEMPVILSVDEQHPLVKANPEIIKAQESLAQSLPQCIHTSMLGLPKADVTHLTPAGLVTQGEKLAEAYTEIGIPNFGPKK
jgi:hypothetical protein